MRINKGALSLMALLLALLLAGCGLPLPLPSGLPVEIPGIPAGWEDLQGMMGELGIPDLSALGNVPGLEDLAALQTPPGAAVFQGPLEMALSAGSKIPGTDIVFVSALDNDGVAQFDIAGLRAPRRIGDSLDYDGAWPGLGGVSYQLRLSVYTIGAGQVRAAGVHRLVVDNVSPQVGGVNTRATDHVMRFPHTVTSGSGDRFSGLTFGYSGMDARGAIVTGLPDGEYPYRKMGDSVEWAGMLTPNVPVEYHLRLLYYQEANATLGGVAVVSLPGQ